MLTILLASVLLASEPVATRVSFSTQPDGAVVTVDGVERGTTPLTLFDLSSGKHHYMYTMPGYDRADGFFNTSTGPFIECHETLAETKGLLLLKSDPEGAAIAINGIVVGSTPKLIANLSVKDTYTVKLSHVGYQDLPLTVKFDGRKPLVREEKLIPDAGALQIVSEPAGAEVTVNGISRGVTPVLVRDIPKGSAIVKFVRAGFKEEVRELSMRAGEQQTLSIALEALPGTLNLSSDPEGARFYLDGEARGVGPLAIPNLKPGEHVVRVEKEGFATETRTVKIENGQSAREEFKLSNTMGRIELRSEPVGVTVLMDGHILGSTHSTDPNALISDVFPIENVLKGEHTLVLRKDGYKEVVYHPTVENQKTCKKRLVLSRIFIPDIEVTTPTGSYRGVLVSQTADAVVIEVSMGIERSFPRSEIRKINFLNEAK